MQTRTLVIILNTSCKYTVYTSDHEDKEKEQKKIKIGMPYFKMSR